MSVVFHIAKESGLIVYMHCGYHDFWGHDIAMDFTNDNYDSNNSHLHNSSHPYLSTLTPIHRDDITIIILVKLLKEAIEPALRRAAFALLFLLLDADPGAEVGGGEVHADGRAGLGAVAGADNQDGRRGR